jgi:hypothetical protein
MATDNTDETEFGTGGIEGIEATESDSQEAPEPEEPEKRESQLSDMNDYQQREKEKIANKSTTTAVLLGIFLSPAAYVYVGKWGWAAANFFTFNFLLLGIIIAPLHTRKMINDANEELREANVEGY